MMNGKGTVFANSSSSRENTQRRDMFENRNSEKIHMAVMKYIYGKGKASLEDVHVCFEEFSSSSRAWLGVSYFGYSHIVNLFHLGRKEIEDRDDAGKRACEVLSLLWAKLNKENMQRLLLEETSDGILCMFDALVFAHEKVLKKFLAKAEEEARAGGRMAQEQFYEMLLGCNRAGMSPLCEACSQSANPRNLKIYLTLLRRKVENGELDRFAFHDLLMKSNKDGFTPFDEVMQSHEEENCLLYFEVLRREIERSGEQRMKRSEFHKMILSPCCRRPKAFSEGELQEGGGGRGREEANENGGGGGRRRGEKGEKHHDNHSNNNSSSNNSNDGASFFPPGSAIMSSNQNINNYNVADSFDFCLCFPTENLAPFLAVLKREVRYEYLPRQEFHRLLLFGGGRNRDVIAKRTQMERESNRRPSVLRGQVDAFNVPLHAVLRFASKENREAFLSALRAEYDEGHIKRKEDYIGLFLGQNIVAQVLECGDYSHCKNYFQVLKEEVADGRIPMVIEFLIIYI